METVKTSSELYLVSLHYSIYNNPDYRPIDTNLINPRRACAARVTVRGLCQSVATSSATTRNKQVSRYISSPRIFIRPDRIFYPLRIKFPRIFYQPSVKKRHQRVTPDAEVRTWTSLEISRCAKTPGRVVSALVDSNQVKYYANLYLVSVSVYNQVSEVTLRRMRSSPRVCTSVLFIIYA